MQVKVSLHVFGSIKGYATLAKSDDVTAEDCIKLESYSFGQTSDSNYLDGLDKNPAIISRPLDSGHWAITRVLKGNPDDYNRQTMLFVTAIISTHDWLDVLHCDVMPLLNYQQLWHFTPAEILTPVNVNVSSDRPVSSSEIREKVIAILCATEKLLSDEQVAILLDEKQYDIQVLRWLNMILPRNSKMKFSYAVHSLSDGIDVDLILLSPIASLGNSTRKVIRLREFPAIENTIFASMVNRSWHKEGMPPWRFIDRCPSFNISQELPTAIKQPAISYHPKPISQESPIKHQNITDVTKASFVLLSLIILGIACYFAIAQIRVGYQIKQKIRDLIGNSSTFLETHKNLPLLTVNGQLDELTKKSRDLIKDIETITATRADSKLIAERDKLKDWLDKAYDSQDKHVVIRQLIGECESANLAKLPDIYPDRNEVERVLEIDKRIRNENILKAASSFEPFEPNLMQKIQAYIRMIDAWKDKLPKLIEKDRESYKAAISILPKNDPNFFDDQILSSFEQSQNQLTEIREGPNLANALKSQIPGHSARAHKIVEDINGINKSRIVPNIESLKQYRNDSDKLCADANWLMSTEPNILDINDAYQKLKQAKELYPKNGEVDILCQRLPDCLSSLIDKLIKADANSLNVRKQITIDVNDVTKLYNAHRTHNEAQKLFPNHPKLPELSIEINECFTFILDKVPEVRDKKVMYDYLTSITFEGNIQLDSKRKELLNKLQQQMK